MGQELSQESISLPQAADAYGAEGQDVFEAGFDDISLGASFQSSLFSDKENAQKELLLPSPEIIADILNDYLTYSSASSVEETYLKVIIPLFNSSPESKAKSVQIIASLFRFLKERSIPCMQNEEKRLRTLKERIEGIQTDIVNTHRKIPPPKFDVSTILSDPEIFSSFLEEFENSIKYEAITPHSAYTKITKQLTSNMKSEKSVYTALKWGFAAGEISAIIDSFVSLVQMSIEDQQKTNDFTFGILDKTIKSISLANTCFAPPTSHLISSTSLTQICNIGHKQTSFIASDGTSLFVLAKEKKLNIINMSKNIARYESRFQQIIMEDLNEADGNDMILTFSNGHLVIASQKVPMFSLYQSSPFQKIEQKLSFSIHGNFGMIPQCIPPFATDSKYFYSLNAPAGVAVFSVEPPNIVFHRFIEFKASDATLAEPYTSEFFPPIFLSSLIAATNGVTISFFRLERSRGSSFTYFVRNFSLVDGHHICDSQFSLEQSISSITYDPWNRCYWGVTSDNATKIINIPSFNSQPPWLTGCDINHVAEFDINAKCETHGQVTIGLLNFLEYYTVHFAGLSFHAAQSNINYSPLIARFFAPCTNEAIKSIMNAINFFRNLFLIKFEINEWKIESYKVTLLSLTRLLDYNLSNLDFQISAEDGEEPQKFEHQIAVIKLLTSIIDDEQFEFLHEPVVFTIVNSIELLFHEKNDLLPYVFDKIIKKMSEQFMLYTLQKIHNMKYFPYCFSSETIPVLFTPILNAYPNIKTNQMELIESYMRSVFMVMRGFLSSNTNNLKESELSKSFFTFADIIFDNFSKRIESIPNMYNEQNREEIPPLPLFEKFFMMLHTFHQSPLIIEYAIHKLRFIFTKLKTAIKGIKIECSVLPQHNILFYSIFSSYLDYINGLMQNTCQIKGSTQYSWLFSPTMESNLTPELVDSLLKSTFEKDSQRKLLKKGLSFNMHSISSNTQMQEDFLTSLVSENESPSIKGFLDYIYKSLPDQLKKQITLEERQIEKFLLAAYAKQLGFSTDMCDLSIQIATGMNPEISCCIRQAVQSVYKTRRALMKSKQASIKYKEGFKGKEFEPSPNIEENYPAYIQLIMKKCIFLVHIQPCLRLFQNQESEFSILLKKLTSFITSDITIEEYFNQITTAKKAREMINLAITYITELITDKFSPLSPIFDSIILEKFSTNEAVQTLVITGFNILSHTEIPQEIICTLHLMDIVVELTINEETDFSRNSFITFFANTAFAVGQIYPELITKPTTELIKMLSAPNPHFTEKNSRSLISLLISMFWVLSKKSEQFAKSDIFKQLYSHMTTTCNLNPKDPVSVQLFYRSGMDVTINPSIIINHLMKCSPQDYSGYISVLGEICQSIPSKQPIFYWILHEISSICSGGHSSFMINSPTIAQKPIIEEKLCKTPDVILSGCLNLIHLVRRFLNDSSSSTGRFMMDIFVYILNNASGKPTKATEDYSLFKDQLLLYGVFAVLSNIIDVISFNSLIKDTSTSSLYYVSGILPKESKYICWQLPISGDAIIREIPFGDNIKSVPTTPFSPSTFPIYDALIPVFIRLMSLNNPSPFTEALSFYAFSSMREYCAELSFFNRLVDEHFYDVLPEFSFDNFNPDFMSIVRSHLAMNTIGFNEPRNNDNQFYYANPGIIKETKDLIFTDSRFASAKGLHVFMSHIFTQNQDISLTIESTSSEQCFEAGFYHLSIHESNIKCLMYSRRETKASISGCVQSSISPKQMPKKKIQFFFDSKTLVCNIINLEQSIVLSSFKFPSSMICFAVVLYPGSDLQYSFSSNNPNSNTSNQIVFRKKRKNMPINDLSSIKCSICSTSDVPVPTIIARPYSPLVDIKCKRFEWAPIDNVFAEYPSAIASPGTALVTDPPAKPPTKYPRFMQNSQHSTELLHFCPPKNSYYVLKKDKEDLISSVINPFDSVSVDAFTGEISKRNRQTDFISHDILPLIHPHNFSILPTEVLNNFASGYAHKLKRTLLSTILLQCYSPSSIGIQESLVKFHFEENSTLLKSLLSLLTSIEPYDRSLSSNNSPINFNLDLLDPNVLQPKSSQFLQKNAITSILLYLQKSNHITTFIEYWFKKLIREFCNITSHSIKENHPYAVIVDLSTLSAPMKVTKLGAVEWYLLRTGLYPNIVDTCTINSLDPPRQYTMTNYILPIHGSTFTITPLPGRPNVQIAAIPIMKNETDTMSGTFLDLIISFKYFILTLAKAKDKISFSLIQKYRARIYCAFIDSFIGNSPFFITYGNDVIRFLQHNIPLMGSDFVGGLLDRLNFLAIYVNRKQNAYINQYLEELQELWDEKVFFSLKHYFPYFASESDQIELKSIPQEPFQLSATAQIPDQFGTNTPKNKLFLTMKRILLPRDTQYGYPFPQLLVVWAKYSMLCPLTETQRISSKLLKVEFKEYVPHSVRFLIQGNAANTAKMEYSFDQDMTDAKELLSNGVFQLDQKTVLYIRLTDPTSAWELINYYFISQDKSDRDKFILDHREWFIRDISNLLFQWDNNTDRLILSTFSRELFTAKKLVVDINPSQLVIGTLTQHLNVLCLRAHFLLILNWLYGTTKDQFNEDTSIKLLLPLISPKLKLETFREIVRSKSRSKRPNIDIDRKSAIEVRDGVSTNFNLTLTGQMVAIYQDPNNFRNASDKPWEVHFANEPGIDAGGPARELVSELATDICSVNCGLVVPTPNARNEIGQYRDTVIPLPNPAIMNANERYRIFGAVIAICIRTGIVQTFNFPPIFWEYMVTGEITIERLYEIDENYKLLIESFKEAQHSGMNDESFKSRLNHKFVITDSRGNEMPLIQRGRTEQVTVSNCAQFISLANEFRLNELKSSLQEIRKGLWENINISPITSLDWSTLEYAACGEREITFEMLHAVTSYEGVSKTQENIFRKVCETLTSEQRALLLRFTTGRTRLPPNISDGDKYLRVDSGEGSDKMPTASTCFHQLHMPNYSSFEKALKLITLAIEYTGSMELR